MGIVIRQSIRSSVVAYCGVVIGYVNLLWLFPYFMTTEEVGLMRLIQVSGYLLATFGQIGLSQTAIKFFPQFKEEKGFLNYLRLSGLAGFLLLLTFAMVFKVQIIDYFSKETDLFANYFEVTLLITALIIQFQVLEAHSRNHLQIIFPGFVRDVQLRILTTLIVVLYGLRVISFDWMIYSLLLIFFSMVVSMMIYLKKSGHLSANFDFRFLKGGQFKKILRYGLYSLIGAGGTQIVLQIDSIMVSGELGLDATGVYTIAFFIGLVIEMPKRSILQIVSPLISQSFDRSDLKEVKILYQKTSINQFIVGGLLLTGIWANLENLYSFIPNNEAYLEGMGVVLFIGLGKLSDMLFGPNGEIIVMSKHYRFNVLAVGILAVLTVVLNLILIPKYGLEGAAFASFMAMLAFNITKWLYVYMKLGFQPFTWKTLVLAGIMMVGLLVNYLLPVFEYALLDLVVRSFAIGTVVMVLTVLLKISRELNELLNNTLSSVLKNK